MLETLTIDDFAPLVDSSFEVKDRGVALRLVRAAAVMESERAKLKRQAFSLFFTGPVENFLPQGLYALVHQAFPQGLEIFIVPIGRSAAGFQYEAIFT